jgi:8-oxo-dGTP pyrophosphatase MutT (NUDIX family)
MPHLSAGLLMYRIRDGQLEVFLAHPGGPYFKHKDDGAWTIPKGESEPDEDLLQAAKREFEEETGITPIGPFIPLTPVTQKGEKIVHAWAFEGNWEGNHEVALALFLAYYNFCLNAVREIRSSSAEIEFFLFERTRRTLERRWRAIENTFRHRKLL